jgi:hypothetical protein
MTEQTVGTVPEAQAQPGAEVTTAQDKGFDLDGLLSEFTEQTKPVTQPQTEPQKAAAPAVDPDVKRKLDKLDDLLFKQEWNPVLGRIRGDIPAEVMSDDELTDLMNGRAMRDVRLKNAWENRASNPAAWSKVEKALNAELTKKFQKLPDAATTEDVAAVTAAVRGASNKAPPAQAPKFGNMSNAEYRKYVKENHGYDPGV